MLVKVLKTLKKKRREVEGLIICLIGVTSIILLILGHVFLGVSLAIAFAFLAVGYAEEIRREIEKQ